MIVFCNYAQVAQSVEQRTENPRVDGSIPPLGTNYKKLSNTSKAQVAQSVEQRTENPRVDGSIPPLGTMNSKGSDLIGAFFMPDVSISFEFFPVSFEKQRSDLPVSDFISMLFGKYYKFIG